jgi:hypothetical protein
MAALSFGGSSTTSPRMSCMSPGCFSSACLLGCQLIPATTLTSFIHLTAPSPQPIVRVPAAALRHHNIATWVLRKQYNEDILPRIELYRLSHKVLAWIFITAFMLRFAHGPADSCRSLQINPLNLRLWRLLRLHERHAFPDMPISGRSPGLR